MPLPEKSPVMNVGRYAGKRIDELPNSYLRWMLTQDFPKMYKDAAEKKLSASQHNDIYLNVTRHALDMFSKRFLHLWLKVEARSADGVGIGTFVARLAQEAWEKGEDTSLHRHQDDGFRRDYQGLRWVFQVAEGYPDFKDVITVMDAK